MTAESGYKLVEFICRTAKPGQGMLVACAQATQRICIHVLPGAIFPKGSVQLYPCFGVYVCAIRILGPFGLSGRNNLPELAARPTLPPAFSLSSSLRDEHRPKRNPKMMPKSSPKPRLNKASALRMRASRIPGTNNHQQETFVACLLGYRKYSFEGFHSNK